MLETLNVMAILVAGLMVGCELSIAAFLHPTLDMLPDDVHQPAASAIARVMGKVMPFWYALTSLLTVAEGAIHWHDSDRLPILIVLSAGLWILVIAYTITTLVPINNRIASWEKSAPPADWRSYRSRWDLLHRWRVVLLTMALVFLIMGVR